MMSDIFQSKDAYAILKNKFVVMIGSSVQRSIYKDLVLLLQKNSYLNDRQLRAKGEMNFAADQLLLGGKKGGMNNGIHYREVRQYKTDYHLVRFYFVTRCFNNYVNSIFTELKEEPRPDVVIVNSCLWDISRYGDNYVSAYKANLEKLCICMKDCLTEKCLCLWNTTLPVSRNAKGGFIVPEVEHMMNSLQLEILEANFVARQIVASHGLDVIDLHHFLRYHLHRRAEDGIHWDMTAHRRITNLLLSHITEALGEKFPNQTENNKVTHSHTVCRKQYYRNCSNQNLIGDGSPLNFGIQLHNTKVVPDLLRGHPQDMHMSVAPSAQGIAEQINFRQFQYESMKSIEERYGGPIRKTDYGCIQHSDYIMNYEQKLSDSNFPLRISEMNKLNFAEDEQENCFNFQDNHLSDQEQMASGVHFKTNSLNLCENIESYDWQPYVGQNYRPPRHQMILQRHMYRSAPYHQRKRCHPQAMAGLRGGWVPNIRFFR
ncbi:PC-esterase domain-containing protein 1A-like [Ylistrum balloti]|uniref:PC-esterase domain-containing protein 1A-like n=1 Tax=Ylistrum balloti TaxID=509963 RepID=UPI002905A6A2|nr:PC-esterase domain-containing protein 1A-like [Ylistrum balloti]